MDFAEFDIEFLAQKMAENPQSPLFARLADLYIGKEQVEEAMELLKEGIKLFPNYYAGYIVLGKAHLAFKEYSRAQGAFEKALELSPFNQTAAQLLITIPNKPDESTRTTDENYFAPSVPESIEPSVQDHLAIDPDAAPGSVQQFPLETPAAEEAGFMQAPEDMAASSSESTYVNESLFDTVVEETPGTSGSFPTHEEYFAQNQERLNSQSPVSLDDYLSNVSPAQNSAVKEEPATQSYMDTSVEPLVTVLPTESHVDPEPVFASPEQAALFAEMNAMNEEPPVEVPQSIDMDSLTEKLQSAEKIVPQENYQPQNPVPPDIQEDQAYETDAVTPTLAEIYASQGEYRAAIQAYEILMFSQPAKGGEYQQRIRELQQKQMEKDGFV